MKRVKIIDIIKKTLYCEKFFNCFLLFAKIVFYYVNNFTDLFLIYKLYKMSFDYEDERMKF